MSDPLDPVAAGVASLLKSLRTRTGLQEERLSGTELPLDTLTGLDRVRAFMASGDLPEQAIVRAVREAASSLEPTLSIVADVSLSLELSAEAIPDQPDLYAPDVGRRRKALLANWNRLHEIRSVRPARRAPSPRALRLEVETEALAALATALTEAGSPDGPEWPDRAAAPGRGTVMDGGTGPEPGGAGGAGGDPAALAAPDKRVFGTELRKALKTRGASLDEAARELSLAAPQIARWETGQDFPSDAAGRGPRRVPDRPRRHLRPGPQAPHEGGPGPARVGATSPGGLLDPLIDPGVPERRGGPAGQPHPGRER